MYDFVKVVLDTEEDILNHPELNFKGLYDHKTGAADEECLIAEYMNLKFIVKRKGKYVELQGSLHKYLNSGLHNWNDFSYSDVVEVISDLEERFSLNLKGCKVINLEVGVNIDKLPFPTKWIIDNALLHQKKQFRDQSLSHYRKVEHQRYWIKIYDKGKQYFPKGNDRIVRFELKMKKFIHIGKFGANNLYDLLSASVMQSFSIELIKAWNDILFFDPTIKVKGLSKYQKQVKLLEWSSDKYWKGLSKQQAYDQRKSYDKIVAENSDQVQKHFSNLIRSKCDLLMQKPLPINRFIENTISLPINTLNIELLSNEKKTQILLP